MPRVPATLTLIVALTALAAGCAKSGDGGRAATSSPGHEAGVDTGRVGRTFVVTYESGPIDRLRLVRDTAGRIVVEGASGFPDGTRVAVTLMRPVTGGRYEPAAVLSAKVELGRFQTSPLVDDSPAGLAQASSLATSGTPVPVRLLVTVSFAPGQQSDEVMHASANGRRFRGLGMHELPDGSAVYEQTLEALL